MREFDGLFAALGEAHASLETAHAGGKAADAENQIFAIDSDEEARLFEELDQLMDAQERAQASGAGGRRAGVKRV